MREKITARTKETLRNEAKIIGEVLKLRKIDNYHELLNILDTRYTLITSQGKVIYDSKNYENEPIMENHLHRPEIESLPTAGEGFDIRLSRTLDVRMAYYALQVKDLQGEEIIIRTSESFWPQLKEIYTLLFLQIIFFIILDATILIFYKNYIERSKHRRIEKMKEFLEKGTAVDEGYLEDQWLLNFWLVVKEWQGKNLENIKMLNQEKILLNRLINSLDVGILLFDRNLELITKNSAMSHLFHGSKSKYLEVIKNIEVIDILRECFTKKKSVEKEIFLNSTDEYLFVKAKYLSDNDQYILTIKNISQEKQFINNQKKFISNISHELKTPLTNIKGYLIALDDAPPELRENFLNIIKNNVQKLENIVTDFLTISKLESTVKIKVEKVPIRLLESEIESSLSALLKRKKGVIEYSVQNDLTEIFTNHEKILMILKNLTENGFIYNSSEIPKVNIALTSDENFYIFRIKDNGIGIPADKLNHIFDRFYRVDEARTSNVAGTGLGLSIVKEGVKSLGGDISVTSEFGEGTEFRFSIRKSL